MALIIVRSNDVRFDLDPVEAGNIDKLGRSELLEAIKATSWDDHRDEELRAIVKILRATRSISVPAAFSD